MGQSKPKVEFQYRCRLFSKTESSYISDVDWDIYLVPEIYSDIFITIIIDLWHNPGQILGMCLVVSHYIKHRRTILSLHLSTETWSGFLNWWQGLWKFFKTSQLAALDIKRLLSPELLPLAVCSPCSGDGALCHIIICVQQNVFFPSRVASSMSQLSHEQTNLHTGLYTVLSCTQSPLVAVIPLQILTLQVVFQMIPSKLCDSSLQLQ